MVTSNPAKIVPLPLPDTHHEIMGMVADAFLCAENARLHVRSGCRQIVAPLMTVHRVSAAAYDCTVQEFVDTGALSISLAVGSTEIPLWQRLP